MNTEASEYSTVDVSTEKNMLQLAPFCVCSRLRESRCGMIATSGTMILYSFTLPMTAGNYATTLHAGDGTSGGQADDCVSDASFVF